MCCTRHLLLVIIVAGLTVSTSMQLNADSSEEERKLISALGSDAPLFEKAKACQRLAVIGTGDAIPALAALLGDEKLAHYARFGLEPIPDPSVDAALRSAMEKLGGKLKIGVINSIGTRRDANALAGLTKSLRDPDTSIAQAAGAALGRIGTPEAAGVLRRTLATAGGALRPAVADSCLACAEALLAADQPVEAIAVYDAVRGAQLPTHLQMAGARGAILAREASGIPLLLEELRKNDYASFAMALALAQEMPGSDVTEALIRGLGDLPPQRRALVIGALGVRGDRKAGPTVIRAVNNGSAEVRHAAIRSLASLGGASALPTLLKAAVSTSEREALAARVTLAGLRGDDVDDRILTLLTSGEYRTQPVLLEVAGRRRMAAAKPILLQAANADDERVRRAAIEALGETVELDGLAILTTRLLEVVTVREALKTACRRMPDRKNCTDTLLRSMERAPADGKCLVLSAFPSVGGPEALQAVSQSARDADETIRECATRVLGEWESEDAAAVLLDLLKTTKEKKERVGVAHALSRIIRRLGFPREERIGLCVNAMDVARSDDERKLALYALGGIPSVQTLSVLTPYFSNPTLGDDASAAAIEISQRIVGRNPNEVAQAMDQVVNATQDRDLVRQAKKLLERTRRKR